MRKKIKGLLVISLVVNVLFLLGGLYFVYKKGGINYLESKVVSAIYGQSEGYSAWYLDRVSTFKILPIKENSIVLLGDSLTEGAEWGELLQNPAVVNRGILGDTTDLVLHRISDITKTKPKKIFLMVGINDLLQGKNGDYVFNNYQQILDKVKMETPDTHIIIQSILPIDNTQLKNTFINTQDIMWLNDKLQSLCIGSKIEFVNLYSLYASKDGKLGPMYTNKDGLHLNGDGYLLWGNAIKALLA